MTICHIALYGLQLAVMHIAVLKILVDFIAKCSYHTNKVNTETFGVLYESITLIVVMASQVFSYVQINKL